MINLKDDAFVQTIGPVYPRMFADIVVDHTCSGWTQLGFTRCLQNSMSKTTSTNKNDKVVTCLAGE